MSWLALDIGGANLKAADGLGWARTVPFALWREPEKLAAALADLIDDSPHSERLVITMTGELCDCYRTKAEGVGHILMATREASGGRKVVVYLVDGRMVSIDEALAVPHLAAASNWHALANFACQFVGKAPALLIDIGSTTTDIVPLVDGLPAASGSDDISRLLAGELVYTGVGRTPICAISRCLPWRGRDYPVAAELFATTADAYVLLGHVPERADVMATADGRPLTKEFARERMARMICADSSSITTPDAEQMAAAVFEAQVVEVGEAIGKVSGRLPRPQEVVVVSGEGSFLARAAVSWKLPNTREISLASHATSAATIAAPAHALAVLAQAR